MEIDSIYVGGHFLDNHSMGEFENLLWEWLEENGYPQGTLADNKVRLKITMEVVP